MVDSAPANAPALGRFVDASPTSFHVVATVRAALEASGWATLSERDAWPTEPGRYLIVRGGSLVAWSTEAATGPTSGFRIVGGHTDSPNLRVKQHPDRQALGSGVVALEPYGGPLLYSWLDRDLGLAGRLALRDGTERLVHLTEPIVRVPSLAIHLSADRRDHLELDRQRHLDGIWTSGAAGRDLVAWVAGTVGVERDDVLGYELMTHDVQPSALVGVGGEFLAAPRLDNQGTCYAGLQALLAAQPMRGSIPVLVLFDHEEVGSTSERGAQSDLLTTVLERIVVAAGGGRDDYHRAIAGSMCASGDMAHATHPNHSERHEPLHRIEPGGGPVLKLNENLRYATDARGAAEFARACERAEVPLQRYVHRADLPCGSTIGPISAARTGITTVDVGAPQWAMHAAREQMAAIDVDLYVRALTAFLAPVG